MEQHTLQRSLEATGIGLHSGERVSVRIAPAPVDEGITFIRVDLPGAPRFTLEQAHASETTLCTGLTANGATVRTVEHLLSSLAALGVDNVRIELDAAEVPIFDGSSATWVFLLREAGLKVQGVGKLAWRLREEVSVEHGQGWAKLTPQDTFTAEVDIAFDHPAFHNQSANASWNGDARAFETTIARARTFGFMHDIETMAERGLARGGSLQNAVVYDAYEVVNRDGLRVADEAAQHKLLDAIGDLWVLGRMPLAHFAAHRPGHAINQALVAQARSSGVLESVRWAQGQWRNQTQADEELREQLEVARAAFEDSPATTSRWWRCHKA